MAEGKARCGQTALGSNPSPALPLISGITLGRSLCFPLNGDRNLYFALGRVTVRSPALVSLGPLLPHIRRRIFLPGDAVFLPGGPSSGPVFSGCPGPCLHRPPPPAFAVLSPSSPGSDSPCTVPSVALHVVHPSGHRAVITISILQMKKPRHGDVKQLVQGHALRGRAGMQIPAHRLPPPRTAQLPASHSFIFLIVYLCPRPH